MTTKTATTFRLGRLARSYDRRVPMLHNLIAGATLEPVVPSVDYTAGMPADLGMMKNDTLGDCTCAAYYHAIQVWSFNSLKNIDTEPDTDVLDLYEEACGYKPAQGGEGPAATNSTSSRTSSRRVHRTGSMGHNGITSLPLLRST